ncbi:MAG: hypothetical protein ACT4O9_06360 [Blastocatellia bacterium]
MPTQITQSEFGNRTILRVEGDMMIDDALLLERIATDIRVESGSLVTVDLADLDLLDSESAPVLRRLGSEHGVEIQGLEIFLQSAVNAAERNSG